MIPVRKKIKNMEYLKLFEQFRKDDNLVFESVVFKQYPKEQLDLLEEEIGIIKCDSPNLKPGYWHGYLLSLLPDYSTTKFTFKNDIGGLGYVGFEKTSKGPWILKDGIRYAGLPTPEVWVHEIWHRFTQGALLWWHESVSEPHSPQNPNKECPKFIMDYGFKMNDLCVRAKAKGYSVINGISVHDGLHEFAVNITNIGSVIKLRQLGLWKEYFECQKEWLENLR